MHTSLDLGEVDVAGQAGEGVADEALHVGEDAVQLVDGVDDGDLGDGQGVGRGGDGKSRDDSGDLHFESWKWIGSVLKERLSWEEKSAGLEARVGV